ncbi:SubName: Full=Uncharacterized protein {ECO:0000313/EMBL:CCA77855.1} [Serendipita indica DSM 11827]|nr:SubName: Full=Uncharacterized protein {ECO:0000313/EMBL:CCA77855.1} [Serendipita indica DSM 11827]
MGEEALGGSGNKSETRGQNTASWARPADVAPVLQALMIIAAFGLEAVIGVCEVLVEPPVWLA